ncbi:MAG TPA: hypothetical protein VF458_10445 [Ktedonobacteraceae bacterium]
MKKNLADPGQSDQPGPVSRGQVKTRRLRVRFTPVHAIIGVLALTLLLLSALASLINTTSSQASANGVLDACPTTGTATATATTGSGFTATATRGKTPTPTATKKATPTPTPTATATPVTPTAVPTTPTATGTTPTSSIFEPGNSKVVLFSAMVVTCSPTAAATSDTQTPDAGTTATSTTVPTGSSTHNTTSNQPGGGNSGGGSRVVVIVGGVVALLLLGLLVGWFFFRRMLLPQGAPNASLPPSGARPWSRTRMPNPDSMGGIATVQTGSPGFGGPGGPASPNSNMFADAFQGPPANNGGFNGPGPQGGNGMGFGGFSDGFIPSSQQLFPQGENSMIPPGSGAFPVIGNSNGFAPASQAFNAMYGLPDDPFSGSQAGSPGWMSNLGNGSQGGPPPANQGNFAPGHVDLNDPYLAEVIRQYSQKSQSVKTQSVQPQQQQMPPNGPPQQMPPNGPQPQPNRPPQQMSPNRPPQQPPSIPQREPRKGFQDSNWLQ